MKQRNSRDTHPLVRIPEVMAALQRYNIAFRVIEAQCPEAELVAHWIESHFPIIGMQVNWSEVGAHECIEWSEIEDLVGSFKRMIQDVPAASLVVVTWSDALCPSLEMELGDVSKVAEQLFTASFDTWIISRSDNWCLEVHHEGTLCFGRGRPEFVFLGITEKL